MTTELVDKEKTTESTADTEADIGPEPTPKEDKPKVPKHDCVICDPFEDCKHTLPITIPLKTMTVGKAGYEDLFKKVQQIVEVLNEAGMQVNPVRKSSS